MIAGGQQKLANGCLLGRVRKLQHCAGEGGQRIREAVVAVDTRDFFDEIDLALQVKPPTGQRDAIATLARWRKRAAQRVKDAGRDFVRDAGAVAGTTKQFCASRNRKSDRTPGRHARQDLRNNHIDKLAFDVASAF